MNYEKGDILLYKPLFLLIIFCLLTGCSKKAIFISHWPDKTIDANGLIDDWSNDLLNVDSKNNLIYGISNDNENLYACLKVNDRQLRSKILMTGLTLWIDSTGRKKKDLGIKFPIGRNQDNRTGISKDLQSPTDELERDQERRNVPRGGQFAAEFQEMELIGFKGKGEIFRTGKNDPGGVNVELVFDQSGGMTYEAVVPFKTFNYDLKTLNDTSKVFSIGFETGYVLMPSMAGGGRMPGGRSGGRSGGRGGRMPAGNMGRSGQGVPSTMNAMSQPTRLWIKRIRFTTEK